MFLFYSKLSIKYVLYYKIDQKKYYWYLIESLTFLALGSKKTIQENNGSSINSTKNTEGKCIFSTIFS
jgi:hypothetical protein